jgi:GT2 family glycosyltransferase
VENPASSKLVSAVIPCLGRPDLTRRCLDSLSRQSLKPQDFDIILVENGGLPSLSPGDSPPSNARRLTLDANYGTAGGFNRGIAASSSKYVLLLNNDVELQPDFVATLVAALDKDPRCAFASGKLLSAADPARLDGAGDAMLAGGGAYRLGHGDKDTGQFDAESALLSACGAAVLFRRSALDEIDGFDEDFFVYLDDLDVCVRAHLAGYTGLYVPQAIVFHVGSATLGDPFHPKIAEFLTRNQIWLVLKNYPRGALLRAFPRVLLFQLLWLGLAVRKGAFAAWVRGALGAVQGLPETLRKRESVAKRREIDDAEFLRLLRMSERQIYRWHSSRPADSRSTLLNAYFRVFPCRKTER